MDYTHCPWDDPENYAITVLNGLDCQCRCGYCFENLGIKGDGQVQRMRSRPMAPAVLARTCRFADQMRVKQGKKRIYVHIFGGEPTLYPQLCCDILEQMQPLAGAGIVTNGVLFTRDLAARMAALGLHSYQISFDGDRTRHDRSRILAGGGGTYDAIMANLVDVGALAEPCTRKLRVNVTADNMATLDTLLADLATHIQPDRFWLALGLVHDMGFGWQGALSRSEEVTTRFIEIYEMAHSLGFKVEPRDESGCIYCGERFGAGGAVVGPNGLLYSCWDAVGHSDRVVGNVVSGYGDAVELDSRWNHCGSDSLNTGFENPARLDAALARMAAERLARTQPTAIPA